MTTKLKNRCSVLLRKTSSKIGTYRPTQKKFYSLQKLLEPYRIQYPKAKTFRSNYRIELKQENIKMGTYKVPKEVFVSIQGDIEQYRSLGIPCKKVRCIETGEIFRNAKDASRWLANIQECYYNKYNPDLIKQCCRGKQKTSYGYHWEFVNEEMDKFKSQLNERKTYDN